MTPCVIFCAAAFDGLLAPILSDALVIAADGGLRHTEALDLTPGIILGDFDSLGYVPADSRVYPVEKVDTDAMLALMKEVISSSVMEPGSFRLTAAWISSP